MYVVLVQHPAESLFSNKEKGSSSWHLPDYFITKKLPEKSLVIIRYHSVLHLFSLYFVFPSLSKKFFSNIHHQIITTKTNTTLFSSWPHSSTSLSIFTLYSTNNYTIKHHDYSRQFSLTEKISFILCSG